MRAAGVAALAHQPKTPFVSSGAPALARSVERIFRVLAMDSSLEAGYGTLMRLQIRLGREADALGTFLRAGARQGSCRLGHAANG